MKLQRTADFFDKPSSSLAIEEQTTITKVVPTGRGED